MISDVSFGELNKIEKRGRAFVEVARDYVGGKGKGEFFAFDDRSRIFQILDHRRGGEVFISALIE